MEAINKFLHMIMPLTVQIAGTGTVIISTWNASPIGQAINPYLSAVVSKPSPAPAKGNCKVFEGVKYCK